jgi:hypothetical protein
MDQVITNKGFYTIPFFSLTEASKNVSTNTCLGYPAADVKKFGYYNYVHKRSN